ncbi:hypothetical protein RAN53_12545 [Halomonas sp. SSL-5]|uniref:hypothetical protein n=1 Tax=Halomonas sp. SSL-5 TaxID=3065855 RepID=UPI002738A035|nr:hypothetical protein [Halomonas sp. SSL-5]MDY7117175.1 hypothetical protein [Halomonas sp. SSL-5]
MKYHIVSIVRPRLLAALLPLALAVSVAQAAPSPFTAPADTLLLAQHSDTDSHVDGDHGTGGYQGAGGQGNRGQRQGKGAGTGEARGGRSVESDIFRDTGFGQGNPSRGGPPEGRGEHEDGDEQDHEDGDEGGGPPEGRGEHEDGEEHDHTA